MTSPCFKHYTSDEISSYYRGQGSILLGYILTSGIQLSLDRTKVSTKGEGWADQFKITKGYEPLVIFEGIVLSKAVEPVHQIMLKNSAVQGSFEELIAQLEEELLVKKELE